MVLSAFPFLRPALHLVPAVTRPLAMLSPLYISTRGMMPPVPWENPGCVLPHSWPGLYTLKAFTRVHWGRFFFSFFVF